MALNPSTRLAPPRLKIAPSLLSADFGRLREEVQAIERAGADIVHVDVMDGSFVPNITIGIPVVQALRASTRLPIDVHLMIVQPEKFIDAFADAGADTISVHAEASVHLQRTLHHIRSKGKKAGVALNPATSEDALRYVLGDLDRVLVMTVNPGFGGQSFLPSMLPKIRRVRALLDEAGHGADLEVDGGINPKTAALVADAGADVFVAGNAVFAEPDYAAAIQALRFGALEALRGGRPE